MDPSTLWLGCAALVDIQIKFLIRGFIITHYEPHNIWDITEYLKNCLFSFSKKKIK